MGARTVWALRRTPGDVPLPPGLSRREKRLAFARRFYEGELPEAALIAYAEWDGVEGVP